MNKEITISSEYFREYRQRLGFSNQTNVKVFFGAKDIIPSVNFDYLEVLNERLFNIIEKINNVVAPEVKFEDLLTFKKEYISHAYSVMKENNIFPRLNNQGRRPEDVYFNWMRGYIFSNYFIKALGIVFSVNTSEIELIGDDDLKNIETFKRSPKADLNINVNLKTKIRIEMQAGFTGMNDVKKHKVTEAKKVFVESGVVTLAIHFDLYNGQVAFIKLNEIEDTSMNWIERQQMEGQKVFNIDQNYFTWKITDIPPKYNEIIFD